MKKLLFLFIALLLLSGCENKTPGANAREKSNKEEKMINTLKCTYKNDFKKFDLDYRGSNSIMTPDAVEEKKNSPVAGHIENGYLYNFDESGNKLLNYYEITNYEYVIDYDMNNELEYYKKNCDKYSNAKYKSCDVTLNDKTISIKLEIDLNSEGYKNMAESATKENTKANYLEDDMYICSE